MRIIPVLDILDGLVVRGVAGRRSEYRPIVSSLTSSCEPFRVAQVLFANFRPSEMYLADLDAIAGRPPALAMYRAIRSLGARLWVDAGLVALADAEPLIDAGCDAVAGLETIASPATLADLVRRFEADRVIFSLDLRDGLPLRTGWGRSDSPFEIAKQAVDCGVRRIIVLDLARVGLGGGSGTESLCQMIAGSFPGVEVIGGGGVSGPADLERLARRGARAALVASALHDGRLGPERAERF